MTSTGHVWHEQHTDLQLTSTAHKANQKSPESFTTENQNKERITGCESLVRGCTVSEPPWTYLNIFKPILEQMHVETWTSALLWDVLTSDCTSVKIFYLFEQSFRQLGIDIENLEYTS